MAGFVFLVVSSSAVVRPPPLMSVVILLGHCSAAASLSSSTSVSLVWLVVSVSSSIRSSILQPPLSLRPVSSHYFNLPALLVIRLLSVHLRHRLCGFGIGCDCCPGLWSVLAVRPFCLVLLSRSSPLLSSLSVVRLYQACLCPAACLAIFISIYRCCRPYPASPQSAICFGRGSSLGRSVQSSSGCRSVVDV